MAEPFVKKDPGDIIRAQDWNEMQVQARARIEGHSHTGAEQGPLLTGAAIAPDAALTVRSVAASGALSVTGRDIVTELNTLTAGIGASLKLVGGIVTGPLVVTGGLRLPDIDLLLRSGADANHGLGWYGGTRLFAGLNLDGPALYGYSGGALGTTSGGQRAALTWDTRRSVTLLGELFWGNGSMLATDQGGSLELGGNSSTAGTGTPYIDFHFMGKAEDFNVRLVNDNDGGLTLHGRLQITKQAAWNEVSGFQSGWRNYGGGWAGAAFMKDSLGFVHLRGLVAGGQMGLVNGAWAYPLPVCFTLPPGFRPAFNFLGCRSISSEAIGRVDIYPDGRVVPAGGNNGWVSLDGIIFQAA